MIARGSLKVLALGTLFAIAACGSASAARHQSGSRSGAAHGGAAAYASAGRASHSGLGRSSSYGFTMASLGQHGRARGRFVGYAAESGYSGHSGGGIQCVTFARADSGIELSGNANTWWSHAEGVYARGSRPEPGSVLNFRANGSMRMGHVAVVNEVLNSRTVDIDHANWGGPGAVRGGISRDITVVDVSPDNDWSAVRVALGHSGEFGSVYPTYGFIYNRPDHGVMVASNEHNDTVAGLNSAPRDLRPAMRDVSSYDEVAEAPDVDAGPRYSRSRRHRHMVAVSHRRVRHGRY